MPEAQSSLTRTAARLHFTMKAAVDGVGILLVDGFHYLALFAIGATTVWSALAAFCGMFAKGRADLSDILLLFIYLEIGAMVGIYFKTTRLPVRLWIYIAITALRQVLIEVGGRNAERGRPSRSSRCDFGSVLCGASAAARLSLGRSVRHPRSRTSVRSNMLTRMRCRAATRHLEPVFRS
jgi:protein PsiE